MSKRVTSVSNSQVVVSLLKWLHKFSSNVKVKVLRWPIPGIFFPLTVICISAVQIREKDGSDPLQFYGVSLTCVPLADVKILILVNTHVMAVLKHRG